MTAPPRPGGKTLPTNSRPEGRPPLGSAAEFEYAMGMSALVVASPSSVSELACEEVSLEETRRTLVGSARKRFGEIPADVLTELVLRHTGGSDFAVRAAALEALHRRWSFAQRDGLVVAGRPERDRVLGPYMTARPLPAPLLPPSARREGGEPTAAPRRSPVAHEVRPYLSYLESVRPLGGSCDCADFLRSSLGLCKHLLVVAADVFSSPERAARAGRESAERAARRGPRLTWDPQLPLTGSVDRLGGLRLQIPKGGALRGGSRRSTSDAVHLARIQRAFAGGALDRAVRLDPERRCELLSSLRTLIRSRAKSPIEVSPAARALVVEELDRAERGLRNAAAAVKTARALRTLKRRLYPYQRAGVERFLATGRLLLADDMGLGKTTQAIAASHALFESGRVARGLVIVPASLKPQWLREWQETTSVPAAVVDGPPRDRLRQYRALRSGFLILNYEQLLRDADAVQDLRPEMVIVDEAQRIKNYETKSAVHVKALTPEYRLVLTGTPMENRLEELASILDWVDDVALAPKWRLEPWHTQWEGDGGKGRTGARHLETLRQRLEPCLVRRVRRDVIDQLPSRTDTRVPVELTAQQALEHEELVQPIAQLIQAGKRRPLTQPEFLKLMQLLTRQRIIANGLGQLRFDEIWPAYAQSRPDDALLEGLFAPKLGELRRLVTDLAVLQRRKIVIFSQWRRMLRLAEWSLRDVLGDAGLRAVFFTGAESAPQRTRNIVDFHDQPSVAIMFLTDAGGVGLNLQRAASACINVELPWNPAVLEQRIGRIYRLGQKRPIDVYNLVSEKSIEARIAELVGAKQALFSGLFDGKTDEIRFDGAASFLSRVERVVDVPSAPKAPLADRAEAALDAADGEISAAEAEASQIGQLSDELPPVAYLPTESGSLGEGSAPVGGREAGAADAVANGADGGQAEAAHAAESAAADHPPGCGLAFDEPAAAAPPERAASGNGRTPGPGREALAALFESLRVERTDGGGVRIEAPAHAAGLLADLFQGMARLVAAAAAAPGDGPASADG